MSALDAQLILACRCRSLPYYGLSCDVCAAAVAVGVGEGRRHLPQDLSRPNLGLPSEEARGCRKCRILEGTVTLAMRTDLKEGVHLLDTGTDME